MDKTDFANLDKKSLRKCMESVFLLDKMIKTSEKLINPEHIFCTACEEIEGQELVNEIYFCDICSTPVHQKCYGGDLHCFQDKSQNWICQRCQFVLEHLQDGNADSLIIRCALCPEVNMMLKRIEFSSLKDETIKQQLWVHLSCLRKIPNMEVIKDNCVRVDDLELLLENNAGKCEFCKLNTGMLIQCNYVGCEKQFHVGCAKVNGLVIHEMGMKLIKIMLVKLRKDQCDHPIFCYDHINNNVKLIEEQIGSEDGADLHLNTLTVMVYRKQRWYNFNKKDAERFIRVNKKKKTPLSKESPKKSNLNQEKQRLKDSRTIIKNENNLEQQTEQSKADEIVNAIEQSYLSSLQRQQIEEQNDTNNSLVDQSVLKNLILDLFEHLKDGNVEFYNYLVQLVTESDLQILLNKQDFQQILIKNYQYSVNKIQQQTQQEQIKNHERERRQEIRNNQEETRRQKKQVESKPKVKLVRSYLQQLTDEDIVKSIEDFSIKDTQFDLTIPKKHQGLRKDYINNLQENLQRKLILLRASFFEKNAIKQNLQNDLYIKLDVEISKQLFDEIKDIYDLNEFDLYLWGYFFINGLLNDQQTHINLDQKTRSDNVKFWQRKARDMELELFSPIEVFIQGLRKRFMKIVSQKQERQIYQNNLNHMYLQGEQVILIE